MTEPDRPPSGSPRDPSDPSADNAPHFTAHFAETAPEPSTFSVPWIVGGVSLLLVVLGAYFLFRGEEPVPPSPDANLPDAAPSATTAPKPVVLPPSPLNLTAMTLNARARANAWHPDSELTAARLTIEDAIPVGPIEFVFGVPRGVNAPYSPLKAERLNLGFQGEHVESRESTASALGFVLPEPNCPLEAAFRQAGQAGLESTTPVKAEYAYSPKHERGVWTFKGQPRTLNVDADNCAILVR